jgi:hypothetical protein
MWRKLSAVAAVLALAASLVVTSVDGAQARYGRHGAFIGGLAAGALALGALGAYEADRHYYGDDGRCYRGRPRCHWVRGGCYRDRWGHYDCEDGYRQCYRPLICD